MLSLFEIIPKYFWAIYAVTVHFSQSLPQSVRKRVSKIVQVLQKQPKPLEAVPLSQASCYLLQILLLVIFNTFSYTRSHSQVYGVKISIFFKCSQVSSLQHGYHRFLCYLLTCSLSISTHYTLSLCLFSRLVQIH